MAKNYRVTVNGTIYDVCVEETGSVASAPVAAAPVVSAPVAAPAAAPAPKAVGAGTPVKAPMNGTILNINVKVGDTIKKDDVVCVLEAMKMENEIFAPQDGKVASIAVSKGSSVNAEDVLLTIQ